MRSLVASAFVGMCLLSNPTLVIAESSKPEAVFSLKISAQLIDEELRVHPVPLHGLSLISANADTITLRTDIAGVAVATPRAGSYILRSITPVLFKDSRYSWTIPVTGPAGATIDIVLTNDNAEATAILNAVPLTSNDRLDPAASIFTRLKHSICRVEGGLAHGTGFVADTLNGVILTNAHVVESLEPNSITVVFSDSIRVRAQLLALDDEADVAVLRAHPEVVDRLFRLPLQPATDSPPVSPGEKLIALGYPLHQDLTVTTGIASSLRAGAIISDVNLNPGNSGGPMLNMNGQVVALNTFGDFSSHGGPGISGSILIRRAGPALRRAAAQAQGTWPRVANRLPVMPQDRMNMATLKQYVDSDKVEIYDDFTDVPIAGFLVTVQTPAQVLSRIKKYEGAVGKDRHKREARAGLGSSEMYSEVRDYRDWTEYVGELNTPVVSFSIVPQSGETGGSQLLRLLVSSNLQAKYKFKGDVRDCNLFRNDERAEPIRGGHAPIKVLLENHWVSLKDVADLGFYTYDPDILRPDSLGTPPSIVLSITDLKSSETPKCVEIPSLIVAEAWNSFEQFYRLQRPHLEFVLANAKAANNRKSADKTSRLRKECEWYYYGGLNWKPHDRSLGRKW